MDYKNEIIKIIQSINNNEVLEYLYFFIKNKLNKK